MEFKVETSSPEETEALAEKIGRHLKGGEVIELSSDLGGGKTTFVRGLTKGFGSSDRVASPTFTISKVYKSGHKELHHFDFYRLPEAGLIGHELADVINDPDNVVVVEWSEVVQHVLPQQRLVVKIDVVGHDGRQCTITVPNELTYLVKDIH